MSFDMHIPDHWRWATIAEVQSSEKRSTITGPFGSSIGKKFFVEHGVPVIRGNNLSLGSTKFKDEGFVFVSEDKAEELRGYKALTHDLIFTAAGTIGQVGIIPENTEYEYYIISNKQMRARFDTDKVDPLFAYYWFSSPWMVDYIKRHDTGSTIPLINLGVLRSLPIPLPPVVEQVAIRQYLFMIDEKINNNSKINQTLEQMAQALFKSWFVDFGPVKAKIAALEEGGSQEDATLAAMTAISGKEADALAVFEREHPEQYAELKTTAELFPSAMQESGQGCIPEGWEYRKIGDYIDNISKTYPLKKVEQVVFLNTGDIKEGIFLHQNKSDVGSLPGQAKKSIREGDILYSEIRPVNKRFAFVYFNADEYVVSTKLMVLRPKSKELSYYLYFLLSSNEVVSYLQLMAESRSGTFPQITYDTVSDIKILTSPDESVIKSFCKFLGENLYIPQQSIIKQNDMLTNIRDTLLPKLLSGEITLPEAEQSVSEAENV